MKKKIYFLMLLFVFLSFLQLHKKTVLGASTANSSPLETYGFRVTILSYTGEGKPEQLGKPILVYQPGLLDDWQEKVSGSYPKGEDAYSIEKLNKYYVISSGKNLGTILPRCMCSSIFAEYRDFNKPRSYKSKGVW